MLSGQGLPLLDLGLGLLGQRLPVGRIARVGRLAGLLVGLPRRLLDGVFDLRAVITHC